MTGLGAQLAAHLYEQTRDPGYLAWATQLYDWNERCLKQSDGLYWNSRDDDGSLNPTLWTYNSGAMIGTATILYRATSDATWLQRATAAAQGSLDYWTAENRLYAQPAVFNEMYFDDLLLLDSVQHDPRYRATVATYAAQIWRANRDATTGLYRFGPSGGGAPDPATRISTLEQAAVVQIMASLAWDRTLYHRIA
ncbi:glycoside hydrolase family 76 protein [Schumannella soli]|uniref:glycoside hydrolase family 76 protein n=1 Tax=Schumannella soli TaxID=2590779 RepID=UPI00210541B4|nr:glycoside hydrolase family 76 protein [Schumannella soli]